MSKLSPYLCVQFVDPFNFLFSTYVYRTQTFTYEDKFDAV